MNEDREMAIAKLHELSELCPDVRIGQLVVNLSYLARGMAHESIWDMEDDELRKVAETQLEMLRNREPLTA